MNRTTTKLAAAAAALTLFMTAPELARCPPGHAASADEPRGIFWNTVAEPAHVTTSINGAPAEKVGLEGYGDVTNLHPGRNTLVLRWGAPITRLGFTIRYGTTEKNVRDVLVVRGDASHDPALRRAGTRTYTFRVPG